MTPTPVRLPRGAWHLCKPTGRGYLTACGRRLAGEDLEVPRRRLWWASWRHELACRRCEAKADRAATAAELIALAGW